MFLTAIRKLFVEVSGLVLTAGGVEAPNPSVNQDNGQILDPNPGEDLQADGSGFTTSMLGMLGIRVSHISLVRKQLRL